MIEAGWLGDIVRSIFFFIDTIIYWAIGQVYQIFEFIANASIVDNEVMNTIMERIGLIISLWMIFRIIFSLIQMLVTPDLISDKDRGVGKIVTRVIISIILLGSINFIFTTAYRVQNAVLESNVLGKVILGSGGTFTGANSKAAYSLPITIFESFFRYDESAFADIKNEVDETGDISLYNQILNEKDTSGEKKEYYVTYYFFVSTLAGGLVCWILLSYCLNLGIRVAKLAFLQIIAPIPILSYIKPKDESLQKWAKNCVSTFLDVFLRLVIIFFAVLLINLLVEDTSGLQFAGETPQGFQAVLVNVAVILGILMFAKQAPDLIKDIFPSMGNDYSLGLKSKINKSPLAAAAVGAVAGGALGMAGNLAHGIKNWDGDKNFASNLRNIASSTVGGLFGGAARTAMSSKKGINIGEGVKATRAARDHRDNRQKAGYRFGDRLLDTAKGAVGLKTNAAIRAEALERAISNNDARIADMSKSANADAMGRAWFSDNSELTAELASMTLKGDTYSGIRANGEIFQVEKSGFAQYLMDHGVSNAELASAKNYADKSVQINAARQQAKTLSKELAAVKKEDAAKSKGGDGK